MLYVRRVATFSVGRRWRAEGCLLDPLPWGGRFSFVPQRLTASNVDRASCDIVAKRYLEIMACLVYLVYIICISLFIFNGKFYLTGQMNRDTTANVIMSCLG